MRRQVHRLPPADPQRPRREGEPAPVVALAERLPKRADPAPPSQESAGPSDAGVFFAVSQRKLEEILDKHEKLVRHLIEVREVTDRHASHLQRIDRILLELGRLVSRL